VLRSVARLNQTRDKSEKQYLLTIAESQITHFGKRLALRGNPVEHCQ
jgi:hypothetical protein